MNKGYPRFISDLHFGHTNMALHRGFSSVEEHDNNIIREWNKVIKSPKDLTYILGDITMEKPKDYHKLNLLKGRKVIVLGNHDRRQDIPLLLQYVDGVTGMINYKGFFLTHCPMHKSEILEKVRGNIHGHNHEKRIEDKRYINVSCELLNYQPRTLEELLEIQDKLFNIKL